MDSQFGFDYTGITFDERVAIRQLFLNEDDNSLLFNQDTGASTAAGDQQ
ncbi:MAG: hypothetical protein AB7U43_00130 [Desulfobacter sp.]